jgi:spermidine synthase
MPASDAAADHNRATQIAPYVLFFVSGGIALLYEVVLSRLLILVMGNTTLATSTILAAFMAGLGLGAYTWGRIVESRPNTALRIFGLLEIGVGLIAFAFPLFYQLASGMEISLLGYTDTQHEARLGLRFLFCLVWLLPPTFLMGGTLPAVGRHVIQHGRQFGRNTAWLYGLNTLGAVLGAFLTGFFLVRLWGHTTTLFVAAASNMVIGLIAVLMHQRYFKNQKSKPEPKKKSKKKQAIEAEPTAWAARVAVIALGLSGFCALAYEVIWTRLLVLVVDNSVYSFAIILMAILAGIALGSLILAPLLRKIMPVLPAFALVEILLGVTAFCFPFFIQLSPTPATTVYIWFLLWKMPVVVLVPAIFMGAAFPLAAEIYQAREKHVGRSLGAVYASNTLGAVLGAAAAGFWLIPILGFRLSTLLLLFINLLAGFLLVVVSTKTWRFVLAGVVLVGLAVAGWFAMPQDYFFQKYAQLEPQGHLTFYDEGRSSTVTIFQMPTSQRILYLNGIPEVDDSKLSLATFRLMGTLPTLLHPDPKDALMVTFGAGITAGAAALRAENVDCVDLVEQYHQIATYYAASNNDITNNPKFSMYIDDARHYLRTTQQQYDVIVSDATHPRSYDSWVLFTTAFYDTVKAHLKEGGIFCQWAPYHGLAPNQYQAILRTFQHEFPHTSVWTIGEAYSLLVATDKPLSIDFMEFGKRLYQPNVKKDLAVVGLDNIIEVLGHFIMGEKQLGKFTGNGPIITDDSPAHLFFPISATMREQYERWPEINFERLHEYRGSVIPYLTNVGKSEEDRLKILQLIRRREQQR